MARLGLGLAALALCLGAFGASGARAQSSDDERARVHFLAGSNYYNEGQYARAAEEFQEAYRLSGRPQLLLNASNAYERALQFDPAIATMESYLEQTPEDAPDRARHERKLASLRELKERYDAQQAAPVVPTPEEAAATVDEPVEEESAPMDALQISGLATGSAGVALGVVSLITGIVANNKHSDLTDICGTDGTSCPAGSQDEIDTANRLATTSTATLFVGLVAIGAGVTLFILGGDDDEAEPSGEVAITTGPGDVGVGTRWSF